MFVDGWDASYIYGADAKFAHVARGLSSEPTSRAGGKAKVVADLKAAHSFASIVMIGDGATDMEARDVPGGADAFIGFGGVQVRDKVKLGADWFVHSFSEIMGVLEIKEDQECKS